MPMHSRSGTSLVELVVALVLFGSVGAAVLKALDRQARLHAGLTQVLESRAQHAATHEALAVTLRGISTPAGDLVRLTDSAVVVRRSLGGGVACKVDTMGVDLAPDSVAGGQVLTRLHDALQPADTLWLLDEGGSDATADDRWVPLRVASVSRTFTPCAGSPLLDPVLDAGRPGWRIALTAPTPSGLQAGAPARLTRDARFALYRSGPEAWLGFAEWNPPAGTWNTIQPVSGPFDPFDRLLPSASGVAFMGRDSAGVPGFPPALLPSVVAVTTRTRTRRSVRMDGSTPGRRPDSLRSLIGLRNAR